VWTGGGGVNGRAAAAVQCTAIIKYGTTGCSACEHSELVQPNVPQQQVAGNGMCAKLCQACTCSAR
jgi:hypothetical protein